MRARSCLIAATAIAGSALAPLPASAHITHEQREAPVGSAYKAVFRVGHGCEGSPTIRVRVQIPDGVISVKPMPKPGWTVDTIKGPYQQSYDYYGTPVSEGVKEVVWSGGSLPDDFYDEFVVRGQLTAGLPADTVLYFPTVQECEKGAERWIEIPAAGKTDEDYDHPAPGVKLLPKK
jgi:uncharacterized protein YcnI